MLWSTVSRTSNPCPDMSCKSSPFFLPDQPISGTVCASWPGSSRTNRRGTHSSSRIRMGHQHLLGEFQSGDGLLAGDAREVLQEIVEGVTCFEVFNQGPSRD